MTDFIWTMHTLFLLTKKSANLPYNKYFWNLAIPLLDSKNLRCRQVRDNATSEDLIANLRKYLGLENLMGIRISPNSQLNPNNPNWREN